MTSHPLTAVRAARMSGVATLAACASLAAGWTAAVGDPPPAQPRITVMTWNIYFGGGDFDGAPDMGDLFESVQATNFAARAVRIARVIDQERPHVICLQEVARWQTEDFLGNEEDDIDFLPILQSRLLARGLQYDIAGTLDTIHFEAPGEVDDDLRNVIWTERIVMLARHGGQLQIGNVRLKRYDETYTIPIPAIDDLEFERGWIAADITWKGKKARYVCTHLEALSGSVRAAQAEQLIDWLSTASIPVVVMGDLNALPLSGVYQQFTDAGYDDAWTADHGLFAGGTCCQDADLLNDTSTLAARIDAVFTRGSITALSTERVGDRQSDRTSVGAGELWPSDHAAVIAKLQLK